MKKNDRLEWFLQLIKTIEDGHYFYQDFSDFELFNPRKTVRQEYLSPVERDSRNYGYSTVTDLPVRK